MSGNVSEAARAACLANNGGRHVQALLSGVGFVGPCLHCERIQAAIDAEVKEVSARLIASERRLQEVLGKIADGRRDAEIAELVEALRDMTPPRTPQKDDMCHSGILGIEECAYCGRVLRAQALLSRHQSTQREGK